MSGALAIESALFHGLNHVLVSSHLGARVGDGSRTPENHAWWQGKVYMIEGSSEEYPNLEEATGYPSNPRGLCGYNCRHNMQPFDPELMTNDSRKYDPVQIEIYYEQTQEMRRLERQLRTQRTTVRALTNAYYSCTDNKLRGSLEKDMNREAGRYAVMKEHYKDYCTLHGFRPSYERLYEARKKGGTSGKIDNGGDGDFTSEAIAKSRESGIIELTRKKGNNAQFESSISDKRFNELTIEARLTGAKIIRDDPWFNARMEEQNASAITYGDVLVFGKNATVSDVIEETYHYKQNLQGLNADKPHELRIILNEIDAKKYLIDNAKKFKIPRVETELTREQLKNYEEQLQDWYKRR